jgi:hypothetical protein
VNLLSNMIREEIPLLDSLQIRSNNSMPERHLGQSPDFASFSREVQAISFAFKDESSKFSGDLDEKHC